MTEQELVEKLEKIERLFAGATSDGEREAAAQARDRVRSRLAASGTTGDEIEYKFSLADVWSRRLLLALMRRYGIRPYRYRGQRRTTVMARVSESFVERILWPEYNELNRVLTEYLSEVTERIVRDHIFADTSEAEEEEEMFRLGE
jgi:hypothetical protein